jgi:hypothetical protein
MFAGLEFNSVLVVVGCHIFVLLASHDAPFHLNPHAYPQPPSPI